MTTPDLFSFFESAHERRSSVEPGVLPTYAPVTAGAASPADLLVDLNEPQREAVLHAGSPVLVVAGQARERREFSRDASLTWWGTEAFILGRFWRSPSPIKRRPR